MTNSAFIEYGIVAYSNIYGKNKLNGMKKKRKIKPIVIGDDYLKIQRKLNRELELERNGGRWISINRVHKSKKAYDRKRDKKVKIDDSCLFFCFVLLLLLPTDNCLLSNDK